MTWKKNLMIVLFSLLFLLAVLLTFYFAGVKKYGTPTQYREMQMEMMKAREDSLQALETIESLENIADSTLFGMSVYSKILEDAKGKEGKLMTLQATIDSLKQLIATLEKKEKSIEGKQKELQIGREMLQDENAAKMAKLYDSMKTQLALPLFLEMNDTLAVKILTRMQERNSARLLGAIGEKDVNKATRLNKLLSMDEVAR